MEKEDATMSLINHLSELRKRLAYCLASTAFLFVVFFVKYNLLISFLIGPLAKFSNIKLVTISVLEGFMVHVKVAGFFAVVVNFPMYALQTYIFAMPAFRLKKSNVAIAFLSFVAMFLLGALFFYEYVLPSSLRFFLKYKEIVPRLDVNISLEDYTSFALYCMIWFGIIFQAPMLIMILAKNRLVSSAQMKKFRKFSAPIIFFIAAVVTPPDVMSQVVLGTVMMLLYEITIIGVKIIESKSTNPKKK